MKHELKLEESTRFEELVDNSIIERYDGELTYGGEGKQQGEIHYRPVDEDHIRQLLISLWGDRLTAKAIEDAFNRLMQDQDEWPQGFSCEELAKLADLEELQALDELEDRLEREGRHWRILSEEQ